MLIWSQRNFAQVTTVTLSWHVQNFVVFGWAHFKPEQVANFGRISNLIEISLEGWVPGLLVLCFSSPCSYIITHGFLWYIYPYSSGLLHWHRGNCMIALVPVKWSWRICVKSTGKAHLHVHNSQHVMYIGYHDIRPHNNKSDSWNLMTSLQIKQMAIHILSEWNSQTFNFHLHLFLKILLTKLNIGSGKIGYGKGPVDNKSSQVQVMA